MKHRVSPAIGCLVVVIVCGSVLFAYWRGLVHAPKSGGGPKGGGPGGPPPPPLMGIPEVSVVTLAGNGDAGFQDGTGSAARFDGPSAVASDRHGGVYVTDSRNHRLRHVAADGVVTTVAGTGPTATVRGDFADGPAAQARLWCPSSLAVAADGAIYFSDTGNHRIRALRGGRVVTIAGGDTPLDHLQMRVGGLADGPGPTARFRFPTGLCLAADDSLLVVDTGNMRLRRVTPAGVTTTVANLATAGAKSPVAVTTHGGLTLVSDPASARVLEVRGTAVTPMTGFVSAPYWKLPTGLASAGALYVADAGAHCLLRKADGPEVLIAGVVPLDVPNPGFSDGDGDKATFACPSAICVGPGGKTLYVADFGNNCVRVVTLP